MSLINDALRRNQTKKEATPEKSDGTPMQPVEPPRQPEKSSAPILTLLIAIVLLAAGFFFWKGFQAKPESTQSAAHSQALSTTSAAIAPPEVSSEKFSTQLPVEPASAVPSLANPQTASAGLEKPVAVDAVRPAESIAENTSITAAQIAAPPGPPELKLQGIFYRITNPTALINGRTVSTGERVDGARVLKIDRQEVTVERNGETKVLTLD